jgi:hypothetical protein
MFLSANRKLLDNFPLARHRHLGPFAACSLPCSRKLSESFSLIDCISVGVDRMQRNFEPMRKQVEGRQRSELTDGTAKVVIYDAFLEGKLEDHASPLRAALRTLSLDSFDVMCGVLLAQKLRCLLALSVYNRTKIIADKELPRA